MDHDTIIELFKFSPAIAALFAVIYLMYKLIIKKDDTIISLVDKTKEDTDRQTKMVTLLEILVNRANNRKGD